MATMEKEMIQCAKCWKVIEKKGTRIFCIPCRKEVDKWLALIRRMKKKKESV